MSAKGRPGRNPRDEAFWAAARFLWDEGYSSRQIGKELGIRYSAVDVHAKRHEWPAHPPYLELYRAYKEGERLWRAYAGGA